MIIDLNDETAVSATKLYCASSKVLRVGITSGCFDMLHYYHLVYLQRCKQLCDVLVVGVDSDRKIKEDKGRDRPLVNERHRVCMVDALKCVDISFVLGSLEQFSDVCDLFIHKKEYGYVFRNQEWEGREDEVVVGDSNARVIIVPDVEELTSTSSLIRKIQAQTNEELNSGGG